MRMLTMSNQISRRVEVNSLDVQVKHDNERHVAQIVKMCNDEWFKMGNVPTVSIAACNVNLILPYVSHAHPAGNLTCSMHYICQF